MAKNINFDLNNLNFEEVKAIEQKIIEKAKLTEEEANCFLSYIVAVTRKIIVDNFGDGFNNRCDLAQSIISSFLQQVGIEHHNVATQKAISDNVEGHSFVVATLNLVTGTENFLIDPTYQQFFAQNEATDGGEPIIIKGMICVSKNLKSFIRPEAIKLVEDFIFWGFRKLDEDFAKIYGDSFLYTKTNIPTDYLFPKIPGGIYINSFLKGNEKSSYNSEMLKKSNLYLDEAYGQKTEFRQ